MIFSLTKGSWLPLLKFLMSKNDQLLRGDGLYF